LTDSQSLFYRSPINKEEKNMDIKLKDYRRGAEIKLTLKDVPATMMPRAIDLFAMLLDEATEKQAAEPRVELPGIWSLDMAGRSTTFYGVTEDAPDPDGNAQSANAPEPLEPAKRRGRPRKADAPSTGEEVKENTEAMAEQMHGAPASEAPLETATPEQETERGLEPQTSTTLSPPSDGADEQPEITDSELQRYSAKLAQHFGAPQKVFDLAAKFVPDGAVPRPTNIRDNGQRWAFVKAAEIESGVKYHG
jgi:hypothetical protein